MANKDDNDTLYTILGLALAVPGVMEIARAQQTAKLRAALDRHA